MNSYDDNNWLEDKKLDELIEATIALADSADPTGKIAKHADGVPYSHSSSAEEIVDWILDLYEAIGDEIHETQRRLLPDDGDSRNE